ncbi:hypothetical protein COCSADRAFT_256104 [Bipolaris sorokiniana ND90Pr]|uniref:Uncharacterized protein n=1 Tax=Cochliobolus sativus (strain ND90Pr / ATCC 201652) TaxID=665912 RepID=M2S9I5_COCSN|nr:uncharacterized protein COCSADRAFT_256104 [Bipolaris sorokiniana ND90Pr]EMD59210.1 hypothetical protein COCSADRAFT_256104 [Bipolaris sorokiniana ND90Pr]
MYNVMRKAKPDLSKFSFSCLCRATAVVDISKYSDGADVENLVLEVDQCERDIRDRGHSRCIDRPKHNCLTLMVRSSCRGIWQFRAIIAVVDIAENANRRDVEDFVLSIDERESYVGQWDLGQSKGAKERSQAKQARFDRFDQRRRNGAGRTTVE